jgi:hypothetical protein
VVRRGATALVRNALRALTPSGRDSSLCDAGLVSRRAKANTGGMPRRAAPRTSPDPFARVRTAGLALPGVEAATKYDGSPMLKANGCFMAGLALHASAEPDTLIVRSGLDERAWLLEDAPAIYYPHPVVLVRLARIDREALRDLLTVSWRLALEKAGKGSRLAPRQRRTPLT